MLLAVGYYDVGREIILMARRDDYTFLLGKIEMYSLYDEEGLGGKRDCSCAGDILVDRYFDAWVGRAFVKFLFNPFEYSLYTNFLFRLFSIYAN